MKRVSTTDSKVQVSRRSRRRSKKQRRRPKRRGVSVSPLVEKYWLQRYDLFSRYDEGIKMDEEGWFSVTPEEIAVRHAHRSGGVVVIDCFAGVGGNAIQFAKIIELKALEQKLEKNSLKYELLIPILAPRCYHVVAIDIDPQKVELAVNNAKIYGVEDYIDFIVGDFFQLAPSLKGDVVFLAPPWGGPSYTSFDDFTLDLLKPVDGYSLFQVAQNITPNIIMFLPRNVNLHQVEELSWLSSPPLNVEVLVVLVDTSACDGEYLNLHKVLYMLKLV